MEYCNRVPLRIWSQVSRLKEVLYHHLHIPITLSLKQRMTNATLLMILVTFTDNSASNWSLSSSILDVCDTQKKFVNFLKIKTTRKSDNPFFGWAMYGEKRTCHAVQYSYNGSPSPGIVEIWTPEVDSNSSPTDKHCFCCFFVYKN